MASPPPAAPTRCTDDPTYRDVWTCPAWVNEPSRLYDANDVHDDTYGWCEGACETWTPLAQASLRYVPVQYVELQAAPAGSDLD